MNIIIAPYPESGTGGSRKGSLWRTSRSIWRNQNSRDAVGDPAKRTEVKKAAEASGGKGNYEVEGARRRKGMKTKPFPRREPSGLAGAARACYGR